MKIEIGNLTEQDKKERKAYPIRYTINEFKNMKIAINAEQPLDAVFEELERLGYKKWRWGGFIDERFKDCSIRTFDDGGFTDMKSKQIYAYGYELITLTELRSMNVEPLKSVE